MPGRTASFNDGQFGVPGSAASSLNENSAVLNSQVAGVAYRPHSVLQALPGMSPNGMSAEDAGRKLPGGFQLPSLNGSSTDSYQAAQMMRMMGRTI
jgi:hypothetical protein